MAAGVLFLDLCRLPIAVGGISESASISISSSKAKGSGTIAGGSVEFFALLRAGAPTMADAFHAQPD